MATDMKELVSCVRGYQAVWTPRIGDGLTCRREVANVVDRYAVGVYFGDNLVGRYHVG